MVSAIFFIPGNARWTKATRRRRPFLGGRISLARGSRRGLAVVGVRAGWLGVGFDCPRGPRSGGRGGAAVGGLAGPREIFFRGAGAAGRAPALVFVGGGGERGSGAARRGRDRVAGR